MYQRKRKNNNFQVKTLIQSNKKLINVAKPLLTNNAKFSKSSARQRKRKQINRRIGNNKQLKKNMAPLIRYRNKLRSVRLRPLTYNWINALVDPLMNVKPVVLPDAKLTRTVSMSDYAVEQSLSATYANTVTAPPDSYGVLVVFNYGVSALSVNYNSVTPTAGYWLQMLPLDINNNFILDDGSKIPNPFYFVNNDDTGVDIQDVAKTFRIIAGGFRFLPKVELSTSDSTQRVTHYHGCCLQINDLVDALVTTTNALQLVQSSPGYQEFTNSIGICLRYNPCQDMRQLDFYSNANLLDTSNDYFGNFYQPAVLINFLNPISISTLTYSYPIMWDSKLWLEADLKLPTPIAMSNTSKDLMIMAIIRQLNNNNLFPCLAEGHSFTNFSNKVMQFCSQLQRAINYAGGASSIISFS